MKHAADPKTPEKEEPGVAGPDLKDVLWQKEALLNAIVQASPIPKFVLDTSHRVISWNRALENITGIPAQEVLGTNQHWKAFYPAERPCLADLLLDGALEKIPVLYPGKFRKSEAAEGACEVTDFFPRMGESGRWLHFIAAPIIGSDGRITGAVETLEDITRLVQAQTELRESEERYSALFSSNYSVSLIIDPDTGMIIDANDAACRYYGYSREQLLSMGIYDLNRLPRDKVIRNLVRAKDEKEKHFLSTHYRADGDRRYVEVYSGPIRVQGKPLFYSIIHDITDRKQAETALRKSEERFSQVAENAGVWIWETDEKGMYTYASPVVERMLGYAPGDLVGKKHFYDLFAPGVRDELKHATLDAFGRREKFKNFVNPNVHKDGSEVTLETSGEPILDDSGHLLGYRGTDMDITKREWAERKLRDSEERYRTLIDQLPDYVIAHRNGTLIYVNRAAAARMGYDAGALLGRPVTDFIAPEHIARVKEAVVRRMAGEEIPPYEMRIAAGNGSYHTVLVNGAAINFEGQPASLNVLTDITLIRQAEEKIRSANEELEKRVAERTEALSRANEQLVSEIAARNKAEQEITRSLEEKDLLLREIHHRVKNNLQIIASLLKLQSRYITDEKVLDTLKESQSRVRAMALVHERIYRSHNIAGINLRDYLNYLTKQVFQFYNIQQHQIGIMVTMEDILADIDTVTPLGLVMNELVSNSLKHAFPDGRKGKITIECTEKDGGRLSIVYHDNGIGMPPGFDWKNSESLGLRLVNNLVDQLNGTIGQAPGEGTTFNIEIRKNGRGKAG